jgi:hypothetical protein
MICEITILTVTIRSPCEVLSEGTMENTRNILTIKEVVDILSCSKTHVQKVIEGKVQGLSKLTHPKPWAQSGP